MQIGLVILPIYALSQTALLLQKAIWCSKKQNMAAQSTVEAEYKGVAQGIFKLLWLRSLLTEINFQWHGTMDSYCDNETAQEIANKLVQHDRIKHVKMDRHFIKEKLVEKLINITFVRSDEQLTYVLTNAVSTKVFHDSLNKLSIRDICAPT